MRLRFVWILLLFVPLAAAQTPDTLAYDRPAEAVVRVAPVYPDSAAQAGLAGRVYVRAFVGTDSLPVRVELVRGLHPLLDSSAVRAVRQWRFRPAERAGQPVAAWLTLPVRFRLPEAPALVPRPLPAPRLLVFGQYDPATDTRSPGLADSLGCRVIVAPLPRPTEQPLLPDEARRDGYGGRVAAWVTLSEQGRPEQIEIARATNDDFGRAVAVALARWRYTPAQCEGVAIRARTLVTINFNNAGGPPPRGRH